MTSPAQEIVSRIRALLQHRSDVHLALLFGSAARDRVTEESDIDIAVAAPGTDLLGLAAQLADATSREIDIVALDDVPVPLLQELVNDAIVLHEGRPGSAARWRFHSLVALETDGPWYRRMRDAFLARLASTPSAREPRP